MSMRDIGSALQILLGGVDISTFKQDGETYNVMLQLQKEDRSSQRHVLELFVRGRSGLIPLAAVVNARETITPREIMHYDRYRSVSITSELTKGVGQAEGLERMMALGQDVLPKVGGYSVRYTGEAEKFFESGTALVFAYLLAIVVVYLVLSAQFESFVYPIAILVAVFLSFTGALVALHLMDMTLNLFSKIGLIMLVGIVTKNSILIVEFSNQLRDRGAALADATLEACRARFRPILMTALATMAGIFPIAMGWGAGGESRAPLGVAVVGGMAFSTLLTFFIVPATYVSLEVARDWMRSRFFPSTSPTEVANSQGSM
jgi:multidrug efflux pump